MSSVLNVQVKAQNQLKHKLDKMYGYRFMKEMYVCFWKRSCTLYNVRSSPYSYQSRLKQWALSTSSRWLLQAVALLYLMSWKVQACRKRGGRGDRCPQLFCRSVNPISIRGAHYPHPVLRAPRISRPCECSAVLYVRNQSNLLEKIHL